MMVAEGGSEVGTPRSDLSESQHWEVIGPHSDSSNAHLIAPAGALLAIWIAFFCIEGARWPLHLRCHFIGLPTLHFCKLARVS